MQETGKREVPPLLRKALEADVYFTEKFVLWANQFLPLRSLRIHYRALEVSRDVYCISYAESFLYRLHVMEFLGLPFGWPFPGFLILL